MSCAFKAPQVSNLHDPSSFRFDPFRIRHPPLHSRAKRVSVRASKQEGDTLSTSEIFESFLKRIKFNENLSNLVKGVQNVDLDSTEVEEARIRGRRRLEQIQQEKLSAQEEDGFLNLARRNASTLESSASEPRDVNSLYEERQRKRAERRKQGLDEYQDLKQNLSSLTLGVSGIGFSYCFLVLSLQSAVSYLVGAVGGFIYLQLLFVNVDNISTENVPQIFRKKVKIVERNQVQLEKLIAGSSRSLSSKNLVAPLILFSIWAASVQLSHIYPGSFQLEFAPVLLGFLSYKAAVLITTFKDNQDMIV